MVAITTISLVLAVAEEFLLVCTTYLYFFLHLYIFHFALWYSTAATEFNTQHPLDLTQA